MWRVILALLCLGCATTPKKVSTFDPAEAADEARTCYTTAHGITVRTRTFCPEKEQIEVQTARMLIRIGAPEWAVEGVAATFTERRIWKKYVGFSPDDETIVVQTATRSWDEWMSTYLHELGHVLERRAGYNVGTIHEKTCTDFGLQNDERCLLERTIEDLSDTMSLKKGGEFWRSFEKIPKKK